MPGISTEYLAEQIQETNRRLTGAIDALRDEAVALCGGIAELKAEVGQINTSLHWMKLIGGSVAAIVTTVALGVMGLAFQVGHEVARIEGTVASLQKTTEELRSDFKARDKLVADALTETRKASEEARVGIKGQSADMARIQETLDRLENKLAEMMKPPFRPR